MAITLNINGTRREFDGDPNTPLLWVIREDLGLTGTKYGCGIAQCGACTVHVDGQTLRSCSAPVSAVAGRKVTTIEGLSSRAAPTRRGSPRGCAGRLRNGRCCLPSRDRCRCRSAWAFSRAGQSPT